MNKKRDKLLAVHNFIIDEDAGECLKLITNFYGNGDPITVDDGVYTFQELVLQSSFNNASFNLHNLFTSPEKLRELADKLESIRSRLVKNQ